ncbi:MAG: hypothetical protein EYC70_06520 [Planctomycetota bacterium]|nr:MAG: hypothetical protein EYC70_06520 [Planctomycetota bacterium]
MRPGPWHQLLLAPLLVLGACTSRPVLLDNEAPKDYLFQFVDQGYLSGPAELWAKIHFGTGEEIQVRLRATNGQHAAEAAKRWAQELNRQRPMTSDARRTAFTIRHVLRMELIEGLRGLQFRALSAAEAAAEFEPTNSPGIRF